jgi:GrpB-like predicted nucleotidyltransferase (UPF0157 family)
MVEIIHYQKSWPAEFLKVACILRQTLGQLALRIDHIGSTSVPGLAAKDVIDIQITVVALDDRIITAMTALGYSHVEDIRRDHRPPNFAGLEIEWEKWYFRPPPGQRPTNTHVRVLGRANQRYALLFRDFLRSHSATAEAYAELKRRLVQRLADLKSYPDVKDPAVDLIYFAGEEWATAIHWQPGPSDA